MSSSRGKRFNKVVDKIYEIIDGKGTTEGKLLAVEEIIESSEYERESLERAVTQRFSTGQFLGSSSASLKMASNWRDQQIRREKDPEDLDPQNEFALAIQKAMAR